MVTTRHPLHDHRVYHKEAVALSERLGLSVLVLAIADRDTVLREGSLTVYGIAGSQRHILRSVLRVGRVLLRVRARVFHIHDFEALALLPYLKSVRHARVIYDVHEHYELMIRNVVALPDVVRDPLAQIARVYEHVLSRMSDHLILVEDAQKPHFRAFAIPEQRMTVVRNLVSIRPFDKSVSEKHFDVVYSGSCYAGRGVYELVDAVKLARDRGATPIRALMMLIGRQDEIERLKARVRQLGLKHLVEIRERVPFDEVPAGMAEGRIGMVLFHDSASHRAGIPTKLMEYGAAGLPALTNDVNAFAVDYVTKHRVGSVIQSLEPGAILDGLADIERDYAGRSRRAREAAAAHSWEAEEEKLVELYRRLLVRAD